MARWTDTTADPNSKAALDFRAGTLKASRRPPVSNRVEYLQSLARGKDVLDVGVVSHQLSAMNDPLWLHGAIRSVASHTLGVDILPEAVAKLQQAGFNVRLCDITRDKIEETFDVMIIGEVIEHLTNPGALFEAASRQLRAGGRLVMTTPNPFYLARMRDALLGKSNDSVDHVTYLYPAGIAEMAERNGMVLDAYRGIDSALPRRAVGKMIFAARKLFHKLGLSSDVFCNTVIYECVRVN
jgi:SAM-dependent methyltransferase